LTARILHTVVQEVAFERQIVCLVERNANPTLDDLIQAHRQVC
jgi:hypothetical protein